MFTANHAFKCAGCETEYPAGTNAIYDADNNLYADDGCINAMIPEDPKGRRTTPRETMPRGKTAKDRCDVCFQIPSSNGACGCS